MPPTCNICLGCTTVAAYCTTLSKNRLKRRGDMGYPCLMPIVDLKY